MRFSAYMSAPLFHISISVHSTIQLLKAVYHLRISICHLNTCSGSIKSVEFVLVKVKQPVKVIPLHGTIVA